jgi:hypothetical protein
MFVSSQRGGLAQSEAGMATAYLYGPPRRLDRKELQIARMAKPRG